MFRIGQGYDVHQLVENGELRLGGVLIPYPLGLSGHSDADVLLHAICDALLGAVGAGDIGRHFPDSDPAHRGRSSREFLKAAGEIVKAKGWRVSNVDATIIAEKPKVAPYVTEMCGNIAADLTISPAQVNIKATTTERLGFTGREEGIAALAVAMLTSEASE